MGLEIFVTNAEHTAKIKNGGSRGMLTGLIIDHKAVDSKTTQLQGFVILSLSLFTFPMLPDNNLFQFVDSAVGKWQNNIQIISILYLLSIY